MNSLKRIALILFFLVVVPIVLSTSVAFVVRWLAQIGFFISDADGVMARFAGVLVDLCLQSAYFTALIVVTRRPRLALVLLAYQLFIAIMFLRTGAPTLYFSIYILILLSGIFDSP